MAKLCGEIVEQGPAPPFFSRTNYIAGEGVPELCSIHQRSYCFGGCVCVKDKKVTFESTLHTISNADNKQVVFLLCNY